MLYICYVLFPDRLVQKFVTKRSFRETEQIPNQRLQKNPVREIWRDLCFYIVTTCRDKTYRVIYIKAGLTSNWTAKIGQQLGKGDLLGDANKVSGGTKVRAVGLAWRKKTLDSRN